MPQKQLRKVLTILTAIVVTSLTIVYAVAHREFSLHTSAETLAAPQAETGVLSSGQVIRQPITIHEACLTEITLYGFADGRRARYAYRLLNADQTLCEGLVDGVFKEGRLVLLNGSVAVPRQESFTLELTALEGNEAGVGYGSTIQTARGGIPLSIDENNCLCLDGTPYFGKLSVMISGRTEYAFGALYPYLAAGLTILIILYNLSLLRRSRKGQSAFGLKVLSAAARYRFLIAQMVLRDFRTKYKRSVLGVLWSFLNPLMILAVQYVVFSTLFRSDIQNYPVYLLTGILCYSFFNEACSMNLTAIVGNVSLLSKVYIPKIIFPCARLLSSLINLGFSLIPLLITLLLTGVHLTPAALLLPFGLFCLILFTLGISLLLATFMVFFRDTQFLWGVLSMIWMYGTPILYPESILPSRYLFIFKMNPLYHVIRFIRAVLLEGASPEPKAYLYCLLACLIPFLLGVLVFQRKQDRFALYL